MLTSSGKELSLRQRRNSLRWTCSDWKVAGIWLGGYSMLRPGLVRWRAVAQRVKRIERARSVGRWMDQVSKCSCLRVDKVKC